VRDDCGIEPKSRTRPVAEPDHAQLLGMRVHPTALHVEACSDLGGREHPAVALIVVAEQRGDVVGDGEDRRAAISSG
jgi:hypothetical protein